MSVDRQKLQSYADRLANLAEAFRDDVKVLLDEAKTADVDTAALRRLVAWMRKDETARAEQEALDDQYRFLAGLLPVPAQLPGEGQLATAAALFADKLSVRAVAKEMGISVGKAHQLKVKAAAFTVHESVNMNTPHDPDTGEIKEIHRGAMPAKAGAKVMRTEPSMSGSVVASGDAVRDASAMPSDVVAAPHREGREHVGSAASAPPAFSETEAPSGSLRASEQAPAGNDAAGSSSPNPSCGGGESGPAGRGDQQGVHADAGERTATERLDVVEAGVAPGPHDTSLDWDAINATHPAELRGSRQKAAA